MLLYVRTNALHLQLIADSHSPRKRTRQINPSSGYVEVLETQQDRLLKAIREWYERTMAGEALCKRLDGGIPHPQRTIYGILESLGLLEEPVRSEFEAAECASCGQGLTHFFDRNDSSLPTASSPSNKGYSDALMAGDGEWLTHGADHAIDDTQSQFLSSWENRRSCQSMSRMDSVSYSNMNVASWPAPTLRAEDIDNWNSYAPWLGLQHGGYNTAEEGCWV